MIRNILILFLVSGVMANASFSRQGDIVIDSTSGLQWQDDKVGEKMGWKDAIDHCEALNLGGYSDWRLPNINELKSIVDRDKYDPAIVSGFTNVTSYDYYWSSSTDKHYDDNAWIVYFSNGNVNNDYKVNSFYVRCVRAGE